jgi:hypothetical protein
MIFEVLEEIFHLLEGGECGVIDFFNFFKDFTVKSFLDNGGGVTFFLRIFDGLWGSDKVGVSLHEVIQPNSGNALQN